MNRSFYLKYSALFFLIISATRLQAQEDRYLCFTGGASVGWNVFGEIGLADKIEGDDRHASISVRTYTIEIKPGKRTIIAPKIGIWGWAMTHVAFGLNLAYYTDFDKGSLVFRPEAGVGTNFGKLVYGYNAPIVNTNFRGVNRHQVSAMFLLVLKEIKPKKKRAVTGE